MRLIASMLGVATALLSTIAAADNLSVAEVGSFHVGAARSRSPGLPTRDVVFTAGSPPIKVDPNGDFEAEQMYVQYVKLAQPQGAVSAAALARRRPHRRHLGDQAGRQAGLAALLPARRATTSTSPTRSSAGAPRGRATRRSSRASPCSAPRSRPGRTSASAPPAATSSSAADRIALPGPALPDRGVRPVHEAGRAALGYDRRRRSRPPTMQLVQKVCPCVIVVHSQGGNFGFNAALAAPGQGQGADRDRADRRAQAGGGGRRQAEGGAAPRRLGRLRRPERRSGRASSRPRRATPPRCARRAASPTGGTCPKMGVTGNTHMLMMDTQLRPDRPDDPEVDGRQGADAVAGGR